MDKIKVLVIPSNRDWSGQHRSIKPHLYLEKKYPKEFFVDIDFEPNLDNEDYLKQYDIVHYHNKLGSFAQTAAYVDKLVELGIVPVLDIDEYWLPHAKHPSHKLIKSRELDKAILDNIKGAKYITTTQFVLADEIRKYNKNVTVLPTVIDPEEKYLKISPEKTDRIKIGWVGDPNAMADLESLKGFVSKLRSDKLLDKVQFVLTGFDLSDRRAFFNQETGEMDSRQLMPLETVWYQYEKIFTEGYTTVSPEYKKYLTTFEDTPYKGDINQEPYRRVWKDKDPLSYYQYFDVVMLPLHDNLYNECRDMTALYLSMQLQKPLIVQDIGVYFEVLTNTLEKGGTLNVEEGNAFLISPRNNHKEWYKSIKKILENPEIIEVMSNNLKEFTEGDCHEENFSMIEESIDIRNNFYKGLLVGDKYNSFV